MTVVKQIQNLMGFLENEFETHYMGFGWAYFSSKRHLVVRVEYPLSKNILILEAKIPTKKVKQTFEFLNGDFTDKVYKFINGESEKLGYKNLQKRKEE